MAVERKQGSSSSYEEYFGHGGVSTVEIQVVVE
jgi:hypothetical protein